MNRVFLLVAALMISYIAHAQTVENIRVEQEDDMILVHYRIGGSTSEQTYDVKFSCSNDGGPRFEPQTVFGDVKENIRGGKSNYTIFWDVFEDLEEVGDVEFFIKVYLVKDNTQVQEEPQYQPQDEPAQVSEQQPVSPQSSAPVKGKETFNRKSFIAYTGSQNSPLGVSVGGLKNFGFYLSFRYGSSDYYDNYMWGTLTGGITKYIYTRGKYRLHGYAGVGNSAEVYDDFYGNSVSESYFTAEFGIMQVVNFLSLTLGLEVISDIGTYPVFGIGLVF
ncbi:MAG: hypothetical protein ABFS38_05370 [Bacteroidota bacterium]